MDLPYKGKDDSSGENNDLSEKRRPKFEDHVPSSRPPAKNFNRTSHLKTLI